MPIISRDARGVSGGELSPPSQGEHWDSVQEKQDREEQKALGERCC